jgi:phospholipid/cholesterol/gamma-HCH transport system ATP-binding protein
MNAPTDSVPVDNAQIEIRDVTLAYGASVIQHDLNFTINRGDIFVIMGGSGCGKSTLLKHMLGLIPLSRGDILYDGVSFIHATDEERDAMRQCWGISYQSGGLFSAMTLAENIMLPLELYTHYTTAEIADIVAYKLALVGLAGYQAYYPSEISGGMQKRAALARAIALDPQILFFDEPSAGLDPISSSLLDELIVQIKESMGATVVMVTHELPSIFAIANNSVYLDNISRTMIACGDPKELRDHSDQPVVRQFLTRSAEAQTEDTP